MTSPTKRRVTLELSRQMVARLTYLAIMQNLTVSQMAEKLLERQLTEPDGQPPLSNALDEEVT